MPPIPSGDSQPLLVDRTVDKGKAPLLHPLTEDRTVIITLSEASQKMTNSSLREKQALVVSHKMGLFTDGDGVCVRRLDQGL